MLSCIHIFEIALGVTIAQGFMLPMIPVRSTKALAAQPKATALSGKESGRSCGATVVRLKPRVASALMGLSRISTAKKKAYGRHELTWLS